MDAAIDAVVADDRSSLQRLMAETPELVVQALKDERFIPAIVHQVYRGDTLLHVAAAGFRADIAADLIARGADVHARNRRGATPLHYAADANRDAPNDQAATAECLLKAGAEVDALDKSGVAPLHQAVQTRAVAAVKALLDRGADPNLTNGSGSTPLFLAERNTGRSGSGSPEAWQAQRDILKHLFLALGCSSAAYPLPLDSESYKRAQHLSQYFDSELRGIGAAILFKLYKSGNIDAGYELALDYRDFETGLTRQEIIDLLVSDATKNCNPHAVLNLYYYFSGELPRERMKSLLMLIQSNSTEAEEILSRGEFD